MNESFGACTQLAGRCAVCPKVSTCDHKRMEHLGYIIPSPDLNVSILLLAYGKKSLDGRKFEKSHEITADFVATQAYSDLYVELASDPDKAAEFMNGVMGADVRKMVAENEAKAKAAEVSAAVAANNARALAVADPQ